MTLAVAHRGDSSRYPENTLLAFQKAMDAGADFIETDLRMSRDGTLFCLHDANLSRIAARDEQIADLEAREIRKIDLGNGQGIPTFEALLHLVDGKAGILLDVKITSGGTETLAARILETLGGYAYCNAYRNAYGGRVVYGVRTLEDLEDLRSRDEKMPVLALTADPSEIPEFLRRGVRAIRIWEEDLTPERFRAVQEAGREVWVTAGLRSRGEITGTIDKKRLSALVEQGVNAVLLNDPGLLVSLRTDGAFPTLKMESAP